MYCDDVATTADALGLLPTDDGANVALLRPFRSCRLERTTSDDGITYAASSQVVVDCLTGTGRMPAEGEALLSWMMDNELPGDTHRSQSSMPQGDSCRNTILPSNVYLWVKMSLSHQSPLGFAPFWSSVMHLSPFLFNFFFLPS